MKVGVIATQLGVAPQTIRNWEYFGLIPDKVTDGGMRLYKKETVEKFVKELNKRGNNDEEQND